MNFILHIITVLAFAAQEKYSAEIYDIEGKEKHFTYTAERTYEQGKMIFVSTFKDLSGAIVATEKAEIINGQIVRYDVERVMSKEKGTIEGKEGKIHFTYSEKGNVSTSKEKLQENTLISATLVPYIETHFTELIDKKEVPFRYAVWFRKEVVGFKFTWDQEQDGNVVIKMVPTNLLYRSLVKPIYFTLVKTSKKLVSIKGRVLPKINKDGAWRDFDGFVKYL